MTASNHDGRSVDPLGAPAEAALIDALVAAGHLSAEAGREAMKCIRAPHAWWRWISRMMLFLGCALVLAGVVFFFAYNWAKMAPFVKFGMVGAGWLGCLVAAYVTGLDRIAGKVLLLSASLLVGVLLAIYGQTYQTGADAYELFLGWLLLILAWVLIGRFAALWLVWLALANVAVVLYWEQVVLPNSDYTGAYPAMYALLAAIDGAALICREYAAHRAAAWLRSRWLRWILLLSALGWLTIPTMFLIVDDRYDEPMSILAALMLVALIAGAYWFFRSRARDLFCLASCALSACVVLITLIGRGVFEISTDAAAFLIFGLMVLGVFTAATVWLVRTARAMEAAKDA